MTQQNDVLGKTEKSGASLPSQPQEPELSRDAFMRELATAIGMEWCHDPASLIAYARHLYASRLYDLHVVPELDTPNGY